MKDDFVRIIVQCLIKQYDHLSNTIAILILFLFWVMCTEPLKTSQLFYFESNQKDFHLEKVKFIYIIYIWYVFLS